MPNRARVGGREFAYVKILGTTKKLCSISSRDFYKPKSRPSKVGKEVWARIESVGGKS